MTNWVAGLPGTAAAGGVRVAGATPSAERRAVAISSPPWYATGPAIAAAHGLALAGYLLGPAAAFVAWLGRRLSGRPSSSPSPGLSPEWRRIRRRLRWLAVGGIGAQLTYVAAVAVMLTLAGLRAGPNATPAIAWLAARLAAVLVVVLAAYAGVLVVRTLRAGWRPSLVQGVAVGGVGLATLIVMLNATYWGLYAVSW